MKKYEFIESYIEGTHGFLIRDDEEKKPLIRCKDCKYYNSLMGHCKDGRSYPSPEWYCADAEEKDGWN